MTYWLLETADLTTAFCQQVLPALVYFPGQVQFIFNRPHVFGGAGLFCSGPNRCEAHEGGTQPLKTLKHIVTLFVSIIAQVF